jgi:hypothetical protein
MTDTDNEKRHETIHSSSPVSSASSCVKSKRGRPDLFVFAETVAAIPARHVTL